MPCSAVEIALGGESSEISGKGTKSPRFSSVVLYRLKFQRRGFQIRRPLGQVERLDANDFFFFVVIENHAGRDFLRFNDLGVIQPRR